MIKLITGKKGTGKTKILIDMINDAAKKTSGNIVCIEKGSQLTYSIGHSIRLTETDRYGIEGFDAFYGFIAGMFAGNFDISEVFVDSILKIGGRDYEALGTFFHKLDKITGKDIEIVFTVSADISELPESVKDFI
ncbi:MAG: hypothetical protein RR540_07660 [Oscillospiraceae bacterium]